MLLSSIVRCKQCHASGIEVSVNSFVAFWDQFYLCVVTITFFSTAIFLCWSRGTAHLLSKRREW
eukprot:m.1679672 g.1679672  ORF g.1679672 m.1679672 type:complete len:64 (-) comp218985_c0_seq1:24-215(-)